MLLVKDGFRQTPFLMNAMTSQHASGVISLIRMQCERNDVSQDELLSHCEKAIRHLQWLSEELDDAFMAATCQSLIEAFHDAVQSRCFSVVLTQYKLPIKYFIQRFGSRDALKEFTTKKRIGRV